MSYTDLDTERILSDSRHWLELNQKWGEPIDLDAPECKESNVGRLSPASSVSVLNRTTFDSAKIIEKVKRTRTHRLHDSVADYDEFTEKISSANGTPKKQFYFVGGNIYSKMSVEEICRDIDDMFKDFGSIRVTTSTIRTAAKKQKIVPSIVENSNTISGLSFDDTIVDKSKKQNKFSKSVEHVVCYIESLFRVFDSESFHC